MAILLEAALGVRGWVVETRQVFVRDHVRLHLDQVEGGGSFLELEVAVPEQEGEGPKTDWTGSARPTLDLSLRSVVAFRASSGRLREPLQRHGNLLCQCQAVERSKYREPDRGRPTRL
ncbi:MAG: hypothetical protein HY724_10015 [Candidatus Rokubacteria bacterium]|nr:hypothetical protein [Candidatus Rokubacteria bacterium]